MEVDSTKKQFIKIHQETFGKTGCRRIVPGQYVAVDPKGRAIMIGAVEKQKFVYVLNRDQSNHLTISSPLEAHAPNTLLYSLVALDNSFENPIFACLEVDYTEGPQKKVTIYELDLGINSVVRKSSKEVSKTANLLIPVPGGEKGPSGVLVCSENTIAHLSTTGKEFSVPLPRRFRKDGDYTRGNLIVAHTLIEKSKDFFFYLQTEEGDLMHCEIIFKGKTIENIILNYFDACPVSSAITVLRSSGHIFVSRFGIHDITTQNAICEPNKQIKHIFTLTHHFHNLDGFWFCW